MNRPHIVVESSVGAEPAAAHGRRPARGPAPLLYSPGHERHRRAAGRPGPSVAGRLTRDAALALLERGGELLASGDFAEAGEHFSRVVGFDDPAITAAALLGLGEAHYRLNDEPAAVQTWTAVLAARPRRRRPTRPGATSPPPACATAT